ncbi:MAG: polyprenyl synthetase family protein [Anaerolineales bacterium]|nr:polyprenyl synthetase family protein [Anaerolineales bacterium]
MTITMLNTHLIFLDPLSVRLEQVETLLASQVDGSRSPLEAALAQLIAAGGKRIRPRLALLTGGLLAADPEPLLHLAAAVEMLHTATLIHDDLVDGAALRRGVETLNAREPAAASVLVGDFAFTRAAQLILATDSLPVIGLFTNCMARMVDSELTQLARPRGISNREEYYHWIGAKTAALFELAAGAPALLGPTKVETVAPARRFGYAVGMAFQIMDDVLDFIGDTSSLGKPAGQDLRQGVLTLPALLYLEAHPADPCLRLLIDRQPLPEAELEQLVTAIRRGGAIEQAMDEARIYVRDGLDALQQLPMGPECFALEEIARSVVEKNL